MNLVDINFQNTVISFPFVFSFELEDFSKATSY